MKIMLNEYFWVETSLQVQELEELRGYAQILRELCINLQLLKLCVKTGMQKELF